MFVTTKLILINYLSAMSKLSEARKKIGGDVNDPVPNTRQ